MTANSLVPRSWGDIFECLVSSDQEAKTQPYSVYDDTKQKRKAENHHNWEAAKKKNAFNNWNG